jgi:outer membrane receptor protein involved in Fe transport
VSAEARYLSSRTTIAGSQVPGGAVLNLHVVQPLGQSWELSGGVQNLFNRNYFDPASGQHRQDAIEQNGRTARIGLRWAFWQP